MRALKSAVVQFPDCRCADRPTLIRPLAEPPTRPSKPFVQSSWIPPCLPESIAEMMRPWCLGQIGDSQEACDNNPKITQHSLPYRMACSQNGQHCDSDCSDASQYVPPSTKITNSKARGGGRPGGGARRPRCHGVATDHHLQSPLPGGATRAQVKKTAAKKTE